MKNLFHSGLLAFALICGFAFTGCQTTQTEQTQEARIYYTFRDTWTVAHTAYKGYCELAVQGKVSAGDQADIDAAWNQFRVAFKFALLTAQKDWQATTPESVIALRENLITLIRSL